VALHNPDPFRAAERVQVSLTAPAGAGLTVRQPSVAADLAPDQCATATFTVDATGPSSAVLVRLTTTVTSSTAGSTSGVRVMRAAPVQAPNLTRTTNDAVFGRAGDRYAIEGAGADLWGATNEFGAIYRDDLLAPGATVTTRVVSQDRTGPWARAGLIVSIDLAGNDGRGFANIAVTPDNGWVFSFDSNGDGRLDRTAQAPGSAPLWVRLSRSGDTVTGSCSADGTTWTAARLVRRPGGRRPRRRPVHDGGQRLDRHPWRGRVRRLRGELAPRRVTRRVARTRSRYGRSGSPCRAAALA